MDYPSGANIIIRVLVTGIQVGQVEGQVGGRRCGQADRKRETETNTGRCYVAGLKIKEGIMSSGIQAASRS